MNKRWSRQSKLVIWCALGVVVGVIVILVEVRTSTLQARYLSTLSAKLTYRLEAGSSNAVRYPRKGPYDQRLGYTALPRFEQQLRSLGFTTGAQARFSPRLLQVVDLGLFPIYQEKTQAGLTITDRDDEPLFNTRYPARVYPEFEDIPPVVIKTLLFIENRELLDENYPHSNPAVEWDRLARASLDLMARKLGAKLGVPGGSTLATQIEKYRHSPGGRTDSLKEKLRQMASAMLRAYLGGPDTRKARRAIVLAYLNSMPLAAFPGYGEVRGLGDGLWAWFGADFSRVNRLLDLRHAGAGEGVTSDQAQAYRLVLSLLLAQRRPAYYLIAGHHDLNELADQYLRLLAAEGIISSTLRDAALQTRNRVRAEPKKPLRASFTDRKTEAVLRARLATVLGVERLYDLDRIDMVARSTIDKKTQEAVGVALRQLKNPEVAHAMGLMGFRLLDSATDLEGIVYSLILYEHTPHGNLLRVQADTYDEPLDVNEGTKLDLGSTAKLRTMVHYLELIATIYQRYVRQPAETLRKLELNPRDRLSRWVIDQLLSDPELSLASILDAALERSYSASPKDGFFTGGGLHTFANFDSDDSNKPLSVREALQNSVNLVFIRLMRDIVYHYMYRPGGLASGISDDVKKQLQYLRRFADSEGQTFLRRFYYKYRNKSEQERLALLTQSIRPFAKRLATVYRSVYPQQELPAFERFLRTNLPTQELSADLITNLYDKYSIERFDLQDRGYIARIHPLELWLVAFLATHPEAKLTEIMNSSVSERQLIYHWLFKTSRRYAREIRIDTLIEEDAFHQIHTAWKRLGYPFEEFTPSFASAIGASGDRPAALTELLGILMNDGVRYPMRQFDTVHFAANTPYETLMQLPEAQGQRVMLPEVAAAARQALIGVVENGTAQRVKGAYKGLNGLPLVIAGKTGTGDHRRRINDVHGRLVTEQVVSRTAIFAVILGERHFGALTAYVAGPEAARYRFTSALPVQILKSLAPVLEPMIARAYRKTPALPGTVTAAVAPTDLRVRRPVRYKQIHSVSRATKPVTSSRSW